MALRVAVVHVGRHRRSNAVCDAMAIGIRQVGDHVVRLSDEHPQATQFDAAVFYGLAGNLPQIMEAYRSTGRYAVHIDLGYWARKTDNRLSGYHKIVVNDRHPTAYFQKRFHIHDRILRFGVRPRPWSKDGRHIVLAGMGAKASISLGFQPEEWERGMLAEIREHTDRPIVYRPKPSWREAAPIEGTIFSSAEEPLTTALANAHALVTHHSNAAVDSIVAGVPAFCWYGVAVPMSGQNISTIEDPLRPEGREQWLADIAWCQWSIREMGRGLPWRHLKDEGLIP